MREWLIESRNRKQLTQQGVADKIGITRQMVSAIENGTFASFHACSLFATFISITSLIFDL
ncbi:MAG: helix-turn-helix transcriptional regulator [Acutalibacteraceae bacterium]